MRRLGWTTGILLASLLLRTGFAFAEGDVDKSVRKLGRGVVNMATGWLELPLQTGSGMSNAEGPQGLFLGLGKGVVWTLLRTAAGIYDTATFFIPLPNDYEPLLQPPTIFD